MVQVPYYALQDVMDYLLDDEADDYFQHAPEARKGHILTSVVEVYAAMVGWTPEQFIEWHYGASMDAGRGIQAAR
jgi:hypothetical protein